MGHIRSTRIQSILSRTYDASMLMTGLHPERICVRKPLYFGSIQRSHSVGIVEPDIFIELLRQVGLEVMARAFGFRPVDDADRALKTFPAKPLRAAKIAPTAQTQHEACKSRPVTQSLVAVVKRRLDVLDLHRAIPFGCRGNRPAVGAKADQISLVAELPAAELTDVVF